MMSDGSAGAGQLPAEPSASRTQAPVSPGVCLAWIDGGQVSGWFTWSLANLITLDSRLSHHVTGPNGDMIHLQSSPRIHEARNQVVDGFARLEQKPEWLFMLDADMTFEPDILERMMRVADPERVPILGGLCFGGGRANDPFPTIYRLTEKQVGEHHYPSVEKVYDYPRDTLVKVGATGAACLLIHRQVLAAMQKRFEYLADGRRNPYPWFPEGVHGAEGEGWGEDTAFCLRAYAIGAPVHVHTGIKLGHVKEHIIDEQFYDARRALQRENALWKNVSGETPATNGHKITRAERRRLARARQ